MKATVYADKDIIGTTVLCIGDFTMGGLYGILYPIDFLKNEFHEQTNK